MSKSWMVPFNVVQEKNWWKEKVVREMRAHVVGFWKYVDLEKKEKQQTMNRPAKLKALKIEMKMYR